MQRFAVLGHPINHSFSPVMHMASFRSLGFDEIGRASCRERV